MKYIFTYCLAGGLTAFLGLAKPVQAAGDLSAIPKEIRGIWALPDCRKQEQMIVFGDGYVLKTSMDSVSLFSSAVTAKNSEYYVLSINENEHLVATIESDGIMQTGYPVSGAAIDAKKSWDELDIERREEYTRCIEISHPLHDSGFAAMAALGRTIAQCSDTASQTCPAALFAAADIDDDKKLSQKEITNAGLMLTYIVTAADRETVPVPDLDKALVQARAKAPALSAALMEQRDRNKSKSLTLDEIGDPVAVFAGTPEAGYFFDLMKRAQNLFPWLSRAAGE